MLLIGRWAVKVPSLRGVGCAVDDVPMRARLRSFCAGVIANQSEHTWHSFEGWEGKVAPVLHSWLLGVVQVYPRCEPVGESEDLEWFVLDPPPGDDKHDNFGWLDGRIVRVDYQMD